jgi:hypothetical protein
MVQAIARTHYCGTLRRRQPRLGTSIQRIPPVRTRASMTHLMLGLILSAAAVVSMSVTGCSEAEVEGAESAEVDPGPQAYSQIPGGRELFRSWHRNNVACRGGSGDDPETDKACDARAADGDALRARGWCRGPEGASGAEMRWVPCAGSASARQQAGASSKQNPVRSTPPTAGASQMPDPKAGFSAKTYTLHAFRHAALRDPGGRGGTRIAQGYVLATARMAALEAVTANECSHHVHKEVGGIADALSEAFIELDEEVARQNANSLIYKKVRAALQDTGMCPRMKL